MVSFVLRAALTTAVAVSVVWGTVGAAAAKQSTKDIRSKFARILKDPSSIQLVVVTSKPGVICGRYNAKNSYGGYVGFKNFTYQSGALYTVGTIVRADGTLLDVDEVTARKPTDMEGIKAMMHDSKAITDEYEAAFQKC